MSQVTVLGMGAMGSRMALALIKAGHKVTVWNRNLDKTESVAEAGAIVAKKPRAAVKNAEFVISMVRDDEASKQVWLDAETGAMKGLAINTIAIESSTLTVLWTRELGKQFQKQGIAFLDAPVAGTLPQADVAQLIYFVGGEVETFDRAQPILQMMGSTIHHTGAVGSGMTIKLAVNALFGIQVSALGELIGFMKGCGLDETIAVEILTSTPVCSPAAKGAAAGILSRNFSPLFPIELVEKDLSYAIETARNNGGKLPIVATTQQTFTEARQQGYGTDNITGIARLYI
jgi:3-hydroxyisobutyrate dehydrogenase